MAPKKTVKKVKVVKKKSSAASASNGEATSGVPAAKTKSGASSTAKKAAHAGTTKRDAKAAQQLKGVGALSSYNTQQQEAMRNRLMDTFVEDVEEVMGKGVPALATTATTFNKDEAIGKMMKRHKKDFRAIDEDLMRLHAGATELLQGSVNRHATAYLSVFNDVSRAQRLLQSLKKTVFTTKQTIAFLSKESATTEMTTRELQQGLTTKLGRAGAGGALMSESPIGGRGGSEANGSVGGSAYQDPFSPSLAGSSGVGRGGSSNLSSATAGASQFAGSLTGRRLGGPRLSMLSTVPLVSPGGIGASLSAASLSNSTNSASSGGSAGGGVGVNHSHMSNAAGSKMGRLVVLDRFCYPSYSPAFALSDGGVPVASSPSTTAASSGLMTLAEESKHREALAWAAARVEKVMQLIGARKLAEAYAKLHAKGEDHLSSSIAVGIAGGGGFGGGSNILSSQTGHQFGLMRGAGGGAVSPPQPFNHHILRANEVLPTILQIENAIGEAIVNQVLSCPVSPVLFPTLHLPLLQLLLSMGSDGGSGGGGGRVDAGGKGLLTATRGLSSGSAAAPSASAHQQPSLSPSHFSMSRASLTSDIFFKLCSMWLDHEVSRITIFRAGGCDFRLVALRSTDLVVSFVASAIDAHRRLVVDSSSTRGSSGNSSNNNGVIGSRDVTLGTAATGAAKGLCFSGMALPPHMKYLRQVAGPQAGDGSASSLTRGGGLPMPSVGVPSSSGGPSTVGLLSAPMHMRRGGSGATRSQSRETAASDPLDGVQVKEVGGGPLTYGSSTGEATGGRVGTSALSLPPSSGATVWVRDRLTHLVQNVLVPILSSMTTEDGEGEAGGGGGSGGGGSGGASGSRHNRPLTFGSLSGANGGGATAGAGSSPAGGRGGGGSANNRRTVGDAASPSFSSSVAAAVGGGPVSLSSQESFGLAAIIETVLECLRYVKYLEHFGFSHLDSHVLALLTETVIYRMLQRFSERLEKRLNAAYASLGKGLLNYAEGRIAGVAALSQLRVALTDRGAAAAKKIVAPLVAGNVVASASPTLSGVSTAPSSSSSSTTTMILKSTLHTSLNYIPLSQAAGLGGSNTTNSVSTNYSSIGGSGTTDPSSAEGDIVRENASECRALLGDASAVFPCEMWMRADSLHAFEPYYSRPPLLPSEVQSAATAVGPSFAIMLAQNSTSAATTTNSFITEALMPSLPPPALRLLELILNPSSARILVSNNGGAAVMVGFSRNSSASNAGSSQATQQTQYLPFAGCYINDAMPEGSRAAELKMRLDASYATAVCALSNSSMKFGGGGADDTIGRASAVIREFLVRAVPPQTNVRFLRQVQGGPSPAAQSFISAVVTVAKAMLGGGGGSRGGVACSTNTAVGQSTANGGVGSSTTAGSKDSFAGLQRPTVSLLSNAVFLDLMDRTIQQAAVAACQGINKTRDELWHEWWTRTQRYMIISETVATAVGEAVAGGGKNSGGVGAAVTGPDGGPTATAIAAAATNDLAQLMLTLPKQLAKDVSSDFLVGDRRVEGVTAPIPVTLATTSVNFSTASGLFVPALLTRDNPTMNPDGSYEDPPSGDAALIGGTPTPRTLPPLTPLRLVGHLGFASAVPLSLLTASAMLCCVNDLCAVAATCAYFTRGEFEFSGGEVGRSLGVQGKISNSSSPSSGQQQQQQKKVTGSASSASTGAASLYHLVDMEGRYPTLMAAALKRWLAVGGVLVAMGRRSTMRASVYNTAVSSANKSTAAKGKGREKASSPSPATAAMISDRMLLLRTDATSARAVVHPADLLADLFTKHHVSMACLPSAAEARRIVIMEAKRTAAAAAGAGAGHFSSDSEEPSLKPSAISDLVRFLYPPPSAKSLSLVSAGRYSPSDEERNKQMYTKVLEEGVRAFIGHMLTTPFSSCAAVTESAATDHLGVSMSNATRPLSVIKTGFKRFFPLASEGRGGGGAAPVHTSPQRSPLPTLWPSISGAALLAEAIPDRSKQSDNNNNNSNNSELSASSASAANVSSSDPSVALHLSDIIPSYPSAIRAMRELSSSSSSPSSAGGVTAGASAKRADTTEEQRQQNELFLLSHYAVQISLHILHISQTMLVSQSTSSRRKEAYINSFTEDVAKRVSGGAASSSTLQLPKDVLVAIRTAAAAAVGATGNSWSYVMPPSLLPSTYAEASPLYRPKAVVADFRGFGGSAGQPPPAAASSQGPQSSSPLQPSSAPPRPTLSAAALASGSSPQLGAWSALFSGLVGHDVERDPNSSWLLCYRSNTSSVTGVVYTALSILTAMLRTQLSRWTFWRDNVFVSGGERGGRGGDANDNDEDNDSTTTPTTLQQQQIVLFFATLQRIWGPLIEQQFAVSEQFSFVRSVVSSAQMSCVNASNSNNSGGGSAAVGGVRRGGGATASSGRGYGGGGGGGAPDFNYAGLFTNASSAAAMSSVGGLIDSATAIPNNLQGIATPLTIIHEWVGRGGNLAPSSSSSSSTSSKSGGYSGGGQSFTVRSCIAQAATQLLKESSGGSSGNKANKANSGITPLTLRALEEGLVKLGMLDLLPLSSSAFASANQSSASPSLSHPSSCVFLQDLPYSSLQQVILSLPEIMGVVEQSINLISVCSAGTLMEGSEMERGGRGDGDDDSSDGEEGKEEEEEQAEDPQTEEDESTEGEDNSSSTESDDDEEEEDEEEEDEEDESYDSDDSEAAEQRKRQKEEARKKKASVKEAAKKAKEARKLKKEEEKSQKAAAKAMRKQMQAETKTERAAMRKAMLKVKRDQAVHLKRILRERRRAAAASRRAEREAERGAVDCFLGIQQLRNMVAELSLPLKIAA